MGLLITAFCVVGIIGRGKIYDAFDWIMARQFIRYALDYDFLHDGMYTDEPNLDRRQKVAKKWEDVSCHFGERYYTHVPARVWCITYTRLVQNHLTVMHLEVYANPDFNGKGQWIVRMNRNSKFMSILFGEISELGFDGLLVAYRDYLANQWGGAADASNITPFTAAQMLLEKQQEEVARCADNNRIVNVEFEEAYQAMLKIRRWESESAGPH